MPAVIVIGDKTDHGGEVIQASDLSDTHGKRIARVGDKVHCPKKGHGVTFIVSGDDRFLIDGKAVAYHGCRTSCGATLISSQAVTAVEFSRSTVDGFCETLQAGAGLSGAANPMRFDLRFLLLDEITGHPAPKIPYKITLDSGEEISGETDADGMTRLISADAPRLASMEAPYYGEISSGSDSGDRCGPCCS